jgi:DNA-binding transcriptional ArsR family regulator
VIRIELDQPTMERTRIAISPLWECVASLHLLARARTDAPWPYTGWAHRARRYLSSTPGPGGPQLLTHGLSGRSPDFFTPLPPSPAPTIAEELDALRATDPEIVRAELDREYADGLPQALEGFRARPRPLLDQLADSLQAYWDATLAGHWPAMRSALEEEVILRARSLAAAGPDAVLTGLHDRVRWDRPTLTVVKPVPSVGDKAHCVAYDVTATDQRLLLVPLLFSRGALICHVSDPYMLAVSYQSRGAAALADEPSLRVEGSVDEPSARLVALLGRGRAAIVHSLVTPNTTAGLATDLGLARSSVSEHLAGLHAAGIVHRHRVGRRVFYGLEPAGVSLVSLLGPDRGFG